MNIVRKIISELIKDLPLSLMMKLSDGKLTTQEAIELSREVGMAVFRVLHDEYKDVDGDDVTDVFVNS